MRTTNPVLSRLADAARATAAGSRSGSMTTAGVAGKAAILLAVVLFSAAVTWQQFATGNLDLLMPAMLLGGVGGFIVGIFLGAISALYNLRFAGLPQQAVLLTFGVAGSVFLLYRFNILRATEGFKRMMLAAMIGIGLFYLGSMLLSLFGVSIGYFTSSGPLAIGINLAIAGVAALNLVLDFDRIEQGVQAGAPKQLEWFAAFGLMVTLIWLYLELLRLLSRLQGRRN